MGDVLNFIERYKDKEGQETLSDPALKDSITHIQTVFQTLDKDQKEEIEKILHAMLASIDKRLETLQGETIQSQQAMRTRQENTKACIAYLESASRNKTE